MLGSVSDSRSATRPRRAVLFVGLASLLLGQGGVRAAAAPGETIDLSSAFPGFRAAFVMRDAAGRIVRHNPELARTRLSPCSTFKIPNSLIGLETGVIPDASFVIPWDGKKRQVEAWNRDHDLRSAIRNSVVPYYQELARRVGPQRMQHWVSGLRYGNEDISGGSDRFWLGSSLRISPEEQVDFLARFQAGELPVSARSIAIVKEILVLDAPAGGIVYRGKTGSCGGVTAAQSHGWWVGSVEKGERWYVFAALIQGEGATGRVCRPLAENALRTLGVLPAR
jgi:beta-lactamase class D